MAWTRIVIGIAHHERPVVFGSVNARINEMRKLEHPARCSRSCSFVINLSWKEHFNPAQNNPFNHISVV